MLLLGQDSQRQDMRGREMGERSGHDLVLDLNLGLIEPRRPTRMSIDIMIWG